MRYVLPITSRRSASCEICRATVRVGRFVHAEADLRAERKRDARAPVALSRKGQCFLESQCPLGAERNGAALHWRTVEACARLHGDHQSAGELVQAIGSGI